MEEFWKDGRRDDMDNDDSDFTLARSSTPMACNLAGLIWIVPMPRCLEFKILMPYCLPR